MDDFEVRPIGRVESALKKRKDAPRQPDEGAPEVWLAFDPAVVPGLREIRPGDEIFVLTWLHRTDREVLRVIPKRDPERGETGVFSTRSPDRPNPIGLHRTEVLSIEDGRLRVRLEAIDGTPVLDVKPVLTSDVDRR
jgi:tRNA-Thr(GGU) m(6)t(6)A37 methyltransferase TsaA